MRKSEDIKKEIEVLQEELSIVEKIEDIVEDALTDIELSLLSGAYEPSERGAGYCSSESGREDALYIFEKAIKEILELNKKS